MTNPFPYFSMNNLRKLFSRKKMSLKESSPADSSLDLVPQSSFLTLARENPALLASFGGLAARCLHAPGAFICLPTGEMLWQQSDFPIRLDAIKNDILTYTAHAAGTEVAHVRLQGARPPPDFHDGLARSCAIAPLRAKGRTLAGALCVLDDRDRALDAVETGLLKSLAEQLMARLELDHAVRQFSTSQNATRSLQRLLLAPHNDQWLESFVPQIAELAGVEYAFVAQRTPETPVNARTLAFSFQGGLLENFEYPLDRSPLEIKEGGIICCHSSDVVKLYTEDEKLESLSIEGFAGISMADSSGKVVGWIVLMDRKPFNDPFMIETILAAAAPPVTTRLHRDQIKIELEEIRNKSHRTETEAVEGIYRIAPDGRFLQVNPAFAHMMGYASSAELLQDIAAHPFKFYADPQDLKRKLHRLRSEEQIIEERLPALQKNGKPVWLTDKLRAVKDVRGELIYCEGFAQDITPQILAEESFRASDARFQAMFRNDDIAFAIIGRDGLITKANASFEQLTGFTQAELKHKTLTELGVKDDGDPEAALLSECLHGKRDHFRLEKRLIRKDQSHVWCRLMASAVRGGEGLLMSILMVVEDISPQKNAEESLQSRNTLFQSMFQGANIGLVATDPQGRIVQTNAAMCDLLGCHEKDLKGKSLSDLVDESDRNLCSGPEGECLKAKRDRFQVEVRLKDKNKKTIWAVMTVSAARDPRGQLLSMIGMIEDVSLRKEAERALLACDTPFQSLLQDAGLGVAISDGKGVIKKTNPSLQKLLDYSEESLMSKPLSELVHPDDRTAWSERFKALAHGDINHDRWEGQLIRKDRSPLWAQVTVAAMRKSDGAPLTLLWMAQDITEIHKNTEALRKSGERLDDVFEGAGMPMAYFDGKGSLLKSNQALQKLLGYSAEELKSRSLVDLAASEDRERYDKAQTTFLANGHEHFEVDSRLARKNGGPVWTHVMISRLHESSGSAASLIGVIEDMTPLKESEQALLDTRTQYKYLFDEVAVGMVTIDGSGSVVGTNRALENLLGFSKEEMNGKPADTYVYPEDLSTFRLLQSDCTHGKRDRFQAEARWVGKTGNLIWMRMTASAVRRPDKPLESILVTLENLALLKESEAALSQTSDQLRDTESKLLLTEKDLASDHTYYRTLFDGAGVGIALLDREERFLETNPELQRMLGYSDEEFRSKTLMDVSHPDDNKMSERCHKQCLEGKLTHYQMDKCFRSKDMLLVWVHVTAAALCREDGSLESLFMTFENFTQRKNIELALTSNQSKLQLAEFQRDENDLRFQEVLERAGVGLALLDGDGRMTQTNPLLRKLFGRASEELASKSFLDFSHPEDSKEDADFFKECLEKKKDDVQLEKRFVRSDGTDFWGRLKVSIVRNTEAEFKFAIGVVEDISDLKELEGPRKETISVRLRSPEEGFLTTDSEGRVVLMNHAAENMLGCKHADAYGKPLDEVMIATQEIRRHRRESMATEDSEPSEDFLALNELVLRCADGTERTILQCCRPLLDLEGDTVGAILVFRDLEEIKKTERELIETGKIEEDGIMDWQIANEFESILTNLNILVVPILDELKSCGATPEDAEKAASRTEDLTEHLATLTGMPQRSLA